jgi:hypothetical protein
LPNFHDDDAKNEVEESNQEVEALIKVYQWWKVLDVLFQLPLESLNN